MKLDIFEAAINNMAKIKPWLILAGFVSLSLVITIGVIRFALYEPVSYIDIVNQYEQEKTAKPNGGASNKTGSSEKHPAFIKIVPAEPTSDELRHRAYEEDVKPSLDIWLTYATVALAVFTFFLFCGTGALAIYTFRLWRDASEANEQQARAFVFLDGFNYELTTAQESKTDPEYLKSLLPDRYQDEMENFVTRFAVQPRWKNGGNTPTRKMAIRVDWRGPKGIIPPEYTYRNPSEQFFVAPQAMEPSDFIEIPTGFVHALIDYAMNPIGERPMLFIWGRADYEDIFDQPHFIEWCYQVRFENHRGEKLRAGFIQYGDYNRSD